MAHEDYLPSTASRASNKQRTGKHNGTAGARSEGRSVLGTRRMGTGTVSSKKDYVPQSDTQLRALGTDSYEPGATSRIRTSPSDMTHICSSCRHVFCAHTRPLHGFCMLILAMGVLVGYFTLSIFASSNFWMIALCSASFIMVYVGCRQFYLFTNCPKCRSEHTSRLDSAHGRQIHTEMHIRSDTSYLRKKI